jgi:hypothetical protein
MPQLIKAILVGYPVGTLGLLLLANTEVQGPSAARPLSAPPHAAPPAGLRRRWPATCCPHLAGSLVAGRLNLKGRRLLLLQVITRKFIYYRCAAMPQLGAPAGPHDACPGGPVTVGRHATPTSAPEPLASRCRLLSLGVLLDFNDQALFKAWFTW